MNADTGTDRDGLGQDLSDLAHSLEIGPFAFQDVLRGGRRRRRQRRALLFSAGAVATAAVLSFTLTTGSSPVPTATASPTGTGRQAVPAPSRTTAPPGRDPFHPVTVLLAGGGSGGHTWKAWVDLWPAVDQRQDLRQLQAMDAVRHKAIPQLPPATQSDADASWRPDTDLVDLYLTRDGKRLVDDSVRTTPAPGGTTGTGTPAIGGGDGLNGTLLGFKGSEMGSTPVLLAQVGSAAAEVVVTWQDGSTSRPALVRVGDSPLRWFAVAKKPGQVDRSIKVYDAHGGLLVTDTTWFH